MKLPRGYKAQVTGQRYIQTMYTAEQMRKAIEKEREECAKVCEHMHPGVVNLRVAAAIRARGQA